MDNGCSYLAKCGELYSGFIGMFEYTKTTKSGRQSKMGSLMIMHSANADSAVKRQVGDID